MEYISIQEASKKYGKSISTIKRIVSKTPSKNLRKGERLNSGKYRVLIDSLYLDTYFKVSKEPIKEPINEPSNDLLKTLQEELKNKQSTIDKLLQNQEAFLENERNFQILLERANQRNELLEQHFDRNRKLTVSPEDKKEEVIIQETKEEPTLNSEQVPNDRATFNEWLKMFKD